MEQRKIAFTNYVAHKSLEAIKKDGLDNFTLRPWNRFNPENSLWWLVPSKEWPAYKNAKVAIFKNQNSEDFNIGCHLEKGIASGVDPFLNEKKSDVYRTKKDWIWHLLIQDIKNGTFNDKLSELSNTLKSPLRIIVHSSYITGNSRESSSSPGENLESSIEYTYKNGLINYVDNSVNGEFYPYTNLQTLEDLLLIFESGELDWSWLDVYIVNEVSNSEYIDIPNLIGTYITEFNEYFSRGE